ncbi:SDR family NAD(P)-dependent oxidoreductase [Colwellia psychrerythraea]|uniref:Short-chain dehydrogenase/reductase SDR n=1 Tax=Colwellia psychrerythraea TaxID=28229 RepID=A0A099KDR1_COLPS|nr:SDR family NAD(P)-dependent oxidoreductase [Colwellia psychrerythraea]KGJ88460.1 short-chain dehydrogenase/reductase SDR [Colwellia psychrerythraea]
MITQQVLIIGANSDIAKALVLQLRENKTIGLILISRDVNADDLLYRNKKNNRVNIISVNDYLSQSIEHAIEELATYDHVPITRIFICNGILHNQSIQPEKRIEALTVESFSEVMISNALTPMLWIQHLMPTITNNSSCKIIVFSARVGSISDNRLGGWYSYRASKAALNMMLKTAAIEIARRNKNVKIIAFHPGTTDTPLSKPFQKNVPENKLFTCEFVAKQLLTIVENTSYDQRASYLDWQGKSINW